VPNPDRRTPDQRLSSIVGRWRTSGHVIGEPPIPVVGTDTYELFSGGYFLLHHVDVTVGDQPVRAIEIIGEPDPRGGYLARSFDSDGNAETMQLAIDDDGVFRFTGGSDIAPAAQPATARTARVRSTLTIAPDGQSMSALWERSGDDTSWRPWMDITLQRGE
jgi:hypothetical protein